MELIDGRLNIPIAHKNTDGNGKHYVLGAVAVPGEPDSDNEILTVEEIEYAAHQYLKKHREMGKNHDLQDKNVAVPVESFTAPMPLSFPRDDGTYEVYPKGTWFLKSEINSVDVWDGIQSGQYQGYSLAGVPAMKSEDGAAVKSFAPFNNKVLIRDLGPDWEAKMVDFVKNPAQPRAKFISVKSEDDTNQFFSFLDKLFSAFKSNSNESDFMSDEKYSLEEVIAKVDPVTADHVRAAFKSATPTAGTGDTVGVTMEDVNKALDEKLKPLTDLVNSLKPNAEKEGDSEEPEGEGPDPGEDEPDTKMAGKSKQAPTHVVSTDPKVATKSAEDIADEDFHTCLGTDGNGLF